MYVNFYIPIMNTFSILSEERVASIRDIQKNPSQALSGITRVTRGSKTIGFFLSNDDFEELVESQEALASKKFVRRVAQARVNLRKKNIGVSLTKLSKEYGV